MHELFVGTLVEGQAWESTAARDQTELQIKPM